MKKLKNPVVRKIKPVKKTTTKKRKPVKKSITKDLAIIEQAEQIDSLQKELEAFKNPQGKLTLSKTQLQQNQLLTILQKTPPEHVHTRKGKGNNIFEYVTGNYVKKVLNFVFGWMWDFQIIDKGREDNYVWVHGRLTIKNKDGQIIVTKDQFGGAEIKFMKNSKTMLDYPNDLKSATTDALKKCASELGIASDIYGKNEFKEVKANNPEPVKKETVKTELTKQDVQERQMKMIKSKLFSLGADTEAKAIKMFNQMTGIMWKDFKNKQPKQTQIGLATLLEAINN